MRLFLLIFTALTLVSTAASGQIPTFLPDSTKKALVILPETEHASMYAVIGSSYYAQFTKEGYSRALDCFREGLRLAEKYKQETLAVDLFYAIGTVYDASGDEPDKILYYYKQALERALKADPNAVVGAFQYSVAHAYTLLHDSTNALFYLRFIERHIEEIADKKSEQFQKGTLLVAYLTMKNNNIPAFLKRFEAVDRSFSFKDGRFPYGRFFAICSWRYAFEKGNYDEAIKAILFELNNHTTDSLVLMQFVASAYARKGDFQNAYAWSNTFIECNRVQTKLATDKDLTVNLLRTDNVVKEKEKALKEQENRWLFIGLLLVSLLTAVAVYFWWANYKSRKELAMRNAEKGLLINEIHHRVKNNLQLLYSLTKLQLPTIQDGAAKLLWQKHLSQLKAMSLVNEKLYNTEGVTSVPIQPFISDILTHFDGIFKTPYALNSTETRGDDLDMSVDFSVSFGLILAELVTNSYKYAFPTAENPRLDLQILKGTDGSITFKYTDFGQMSDPSVFESKKTGGAALMRDLTRQLKGKLTIETEPHLTFCFVFPI
jgi:two-component sensor histidine kinase